MKKSIIDLSFSFASGIVVAIFGWGYSIVSAWGAPRDLPRNGFPALCDFLLRHSLWALLIPGIILLAGIIQIRQGSEAGLRLAVATGWLASLIWLCIVLLVWQLPAIPMITGMRLHY